MDVASNSIYPTPYANSTLLPLLLLSLAQQKNSPTTSETFKKEYDFIVVGAGSAGAVVASRLSEVPCVNVLLLEAGKPPPLITDIPAIWTDFWNTDIDWSYLTVPQKNTARDMVNNQVKWPRGKTLGGSSVLNAMLYVRANKKNYADWADQGAVGWNTSDVWPYFLKLENNHDPEYLANGYHVREGPIDVETPKYTAEIKPPIREAFEQMGYKVVDSNGKTQTGFYDAQTTTRNGQRCSTAKAYLVPAENRTNLDIVPNAFVTKILFENDRAVAVKLDYKNETHEVKASKEIIISAGAINTPQLLLLSGIGPKKHLEELNIKCVEDLPVGENLQEQLSVPIFFYVNSSIDRKSQKLKDQDNVIEYVNNRTGILSSTMSWVAFLEAEKNKSSRQDFPDYELYFYETEASTVKQHLKEEVYNKVYAPYENKTSFLCISKILQPKSRGTIRLKSSNPYDHPLIDPNYLSEPEDLSVIVEGLKLCHKIGTSSTMKKIGSTRYEEPHPGCKNFPLDDDKYYECLARSLMVTVYHPIGTAKMGSPDDSKTVVDPQLRVKGIKGLRVADASIMPLLPSGNPNVPIIMVGEKVSDMIKSTLHCNSS